jgi:hypothetical protein
MADLHIGFAVEEARKIPDPDVRGGQEPGKPRGVTSAQAPSDAPRSTGVEMPWRRRPLSSEQKVAVEGDKISVHPRFAGVSLLSCGD